MYVRVYDVTYKNKQLPSSNYNGTYLQYGHTFGTIFKGTKFQGLVNMQTQHLGPQKMP